jgi:hypothetical protein
VATGARTGTEIGAVGEAGATRERRVEEGLPAGAGEAVVDGVAAGGTVARVAEEVAFVDAALELAVADARAEVGTGGVEAGRVHSRGGGTADGVALVAAAGASGLAVLLAEEGPSHLLCFVEAGGGGGSSTAAAGYFDGLAARWAGASVAGLFAGVEAAGELLAAAVGASGDGISAGGARGGGQVAQVDFAAGAGGDLGREEGAGGTLTGVTGEGALVVAAGEGVTASVSTGEVARLSAGEIDHAAAAGLFFFSFGAVATLHFSECAHFAWAFVANIFAPMFPALEGLVTDLSTTLSFEFLATAQTKFFFPAEAGSDWTECCTGRTVARVAHESAGMWTVSANSMLSTGFSARVGNEIGIVLRFGDFAAIAFVGRFFQ